MIDASRRRNRVVAAAFGGVAVVVLVWAGLVLLPALQPTRTEPACQCPLVSTLALEGPSEASRGSTHWYNFTVVSAAAGIGVSNLQIEVIGSTGDVRSPGDGWSLVALTGSGGLLADYEPRGGSWAASGTAAVDPSDVFVLCSGASDLGGAGDSLSVSFGGETFQGSISVSIP